MEFEKNTDDTSPEISNAARLSAATKHVVLTPLHSDVVPEERPIADDDSGDTLHAGGMAYATIDTESEDTSTYQNQSTAAPQPEAASQPPIKLIVVGVVAVLIAAGAYAYMQLGQ